MRILFTLLFLAISTSSIAESNRSHKAKKAFKLTNPCPSTGRVKGSCPGYVIDHIEALACGGLDHPSNMQWQTKEDAKQKDRWERANCK